MKNWICRQYGPPSVLQLNEAADPSPGADEIVVRVRATTVSTADVRIRGCRFPSGMGVLGRLTLGIRGPRQPVLGADCVGVVEAVGAETRKWNPGDRVLVVKGAAMGCHAERVLARAKDVVVALPHGLGWAEAASIPFGSQTARHFLRKSGLKAGDEVLVIGASGAVGAAALQCIALAGARAIAVTRSVNAEWVTTLGAAEIIDYTTTDYITSDRRFDLVMDCVGAGTFKSMRHLVKPGGAYLAVAGGLPDYLSRPRDGVRCVVGYVPESTTVISDLMDLVASGKMRPMVGERFDFDDIPAAHALVDGGHKRGALVVEIGGSEA